MLPNLEDWVRLHGTFKADPNKKVVGVEYQIEAKDAVSTTDGVDRKPIYFTDIQFQAGNQLSGWIPNTKEMLQRLSRTYDQWANVASPYSFAGSPPQTYHNVDYRLFNILGRGHGTIVVPNYFPEDWDIPILPTGIDLTIYPKEDFDLLRISTSHGAWLPEEEQRYKQDGGIYQIVKDKYEYVTSEYFVIDGEESEKEYNSAVSNWNNIIKPIFENHPLHKRYTREFWVDGASAGSEIKIHATTHTAKINGNDIKIVGEHSFDVNGYVFEIDRKKFMLAPQGCATIRVEFYKQRERTITLREGSNTSDYTFRYLEDAGIGYYGTAGMYQWTYGKTRI